jgi:uncharacterized protein (TIGR02284 family)
MARMLRDVIALLNRLIALDYDAIEGYKAAIERLSADGDRMRLTDFLGDHRRHVAELGLIVRNLGGEPTSHGDIKQVVARGKVVLGGLAGDGSVLDAVRSNEEQIERAYAQTLAQPGIPMDVRSVIEKNLAEERGHGEWLVRRIDSTKPTIGLPAPTRGI